MQSLQNSNFYGGIISLLLIRFNTFCFYGRLYLFIYLFIFFISNAHIFIAVAEKYDKYFVNKISIIYIDIVKNETMRKRELRR